MVNTLYSAEAEPEASESAPLPTSNFWNKDWKEWKACFFYSSILKKENENAQKLTIQNNDADWKPLNVQHQKELKKARWELISS